MSYEAVEHLSRTFAHQPQRSRHKRRISREDLEDQPGLVEGWFLLLLLAAVVYSAIWCVQFAITSPSMSFLTYVTAAGLALGVYAARQSRFPRFLFHGVAIAGALLIAYWLASGSSSGDTSSPLFQRIVIWFNLLVAGGVSNDDAIFVFFVATLAFILAYTSAWLIYRTRSPWLVIAANAAVLLISLNNGNPGLVVFLIAFVLSSLLLLLRFNLGEWMLRWQRQGLRYADDLGWDIMQAGALISIAIIVFSWVLPGSYLDPALSQVWNADNGPVSQVTNTWNRLFSIRGGSDSTSRGSFRENLVLGGNPNLSDEPVFTVTSKEGTVPYLAFVSYDNYDKGQWSIKNAQVTDAIPANTAVFSPSPRVVNLTITIKNPPSEQHPYIAAPYTVVSMNIPARLLTDQNGSVIAWLSANGGLPAGTTYTVQSSLSATDVPTLKTVPMPADAPPYPEGEELRADIPVPIDAYSPSVMQTYTGLPKGLDPRIKELALQVTKNASTMYEKMETLETFLRTYTYSLDVNPPVGKDPVSWFLFDGKKGFCNYYASAMVLMARSLGIPARVVTGYRYGSVEDGVNVIKGKDAHSWPQIYFAGYGWIDFEPTAAFPTLARPQPHQYSQNNPATSSNNSASSNLPLPKKPFNENEYAGAPGSGTSADDTQVSLSRALVALSGTLVVLVLLSVFVLGIWWRRLFRRYSLATQIYGRICLLADLAGVQWRSSQTPYEYLEKLSASALPASADATSLQRLGDIYVRERWADPDSPEHPANSNEAGELPDIWRRLRIRLFAYTLRHPYFLRWLPAVVWRQLVRIWKAIRTRRSLDDEF